jgi:hypothetical protein
MGRIIELVVIAILVGLACSGIFEIVKDRFLKLCVLDRSVTLLSLIVLAVAIIMIQEHVPTFEEVHFTVPIPIPSLHQFQIAQIEVTTRAGLVPSMLLGIFITFIALSEVYRAQLTEDEDNRAPPDSLVQAYAQNPLVLYPMLALSYKSFVSPEGVSGVFSFAFLGTMILGTLFFPGTKRTIQTTGQWALFIAFAIVYAGSITLAAML